MSQRGISITREMTISASSSEVFELLLSDKDLQKIFTGYGILPAVSGYSNQTGPPGQPGSQRRVHLRDGTFVHERITASERPHYLAFRIVEPSSLLDYNLSEGHGEWVLTDIYPGTRLKWTYTFLPRNVITGLLLKVLVLPPWRRYMDVILVNIQRHFGVSA